MFRYLSIIIILHTDWHSGRHTSLKSNNLAIFEQLEVNKKHHKSKEHDNALANIRNKAQTLCLISQRLAFWINQIKQCRFMQHLQYACHMTLTMSNWLYLNALMVIISFQIQGKVFLNQDSKNFTFIIQPRNNGVLKTYERGLRLTM